MNLLEPIPRVIRIVLFASLALTLNACSPGVIHRDDALIERIFQAQDSEEVAKDALLRLMADADVVYLGEKHDNPRHHELQQDIIAALTARAKEPAIGFESFSLEQTSFLLQYVRSPESPLAKTPSVTAEERLRRQLGWGPERDNDWARYEPVLKFARDKRLTVFGLDLPAGLRLRLSREGLAGLTRLERRLLYPSGFSDNNYRQLMVEKLTVAHCGWNDKKVLGNLYETWIARNDAMATAITEMLVEGVGQPIVVILGGGHVQHNMGVYERVAHRRPGVVQLNLGMREIAVHPTVLADYLEAPLVEGVRYRPSHEFVWFTRRVDYNDPCERFRHRAKGKALTKS